MDIIKFKNFLNENSTIAFDDEIKIELSKLLSNTKWIKTNSVEYRTNQLIDLHKKWIEIVKDKLSAEEIAKSLYKYDKNME